MSDVHEVLARLPDPETPDAFRANVMARIERHVERRQPVATGGRVENPADRPVWLWAFAGMAVALWAAGSTFWGTGTLPDVTSARIGLGRSALLPLDGLAAEAFAVGLFVFLGGLFAPLRKRWDRERSS
jgi:hypothetical protein